MSVRNLDYPLSYPQGYPPTFVVTLITHSRHPDVAPASSRCTFSFDNMKLTNWGLLQYILICAVELFVVYINFASTDRPNLA